MPSRPQRFRAKIQKQGPNSYIEVPASASAAFARYAHLGRVRVHGTLDGAGIRGNLVPRAGGRWLFLHAGMRAAAGVGPGDVVTVVLRATSWDRVPLAKDVKAALKKAGALATFEARSPSQRHELLRWVDVAESPQQRAKRLSEMLKTLHGKSARVKKGRAPRRLEPLWKCPKCGHRFVNKNQWHSCKRYTLREVFARSEPAVQKLFRQIRTMVEGVGPVHVQAYRDHVAFLVRVRFLGVTPKKSFLDLGFWFPRRIDSPRFRKVETLTPTDHVHLLRVTSPDELDEEVQGWIREGYAVGRQEHLA